MPYLHCAMVSSRIGMFHVSLNWNSKTFFLVLRFRDIPVIELADYNLSCIDYYRAIFNRMITNVTSAKNAINLTRYSSVMILSSFLLCDCFFNAVFSRPSKTIFIFLKLRTIDRILLSKRRILAIVFGHFSSIISEIQQCK